MAKNVGFLSRIQRLLSLSFTSTIRKKSTSKHLNKPKSRKLFWAARSLVLSRAIKDWYAHKLTRLLGLVEYIYWSSSYLEILTLFGWDIVPIFLKTGTERKIRGLMSFTLQHYSKTFTLNTLQWSLLKLENVKKYRHYAPKLVKV